MAAMEVLAVPPRDRLIPAAVRRAVIERDGLICQLCGCSVTPETLHLDHIVHWAAGGESTVENLRVACEPCNLSRPGPAVVTRRVVPGAAVPHWIKIPAAEARRKRRRAVAFGLAEPSPVDPLLVAAVQFAADRVATLSARQRRAAQ